MGGFSLVEMLVVIAVIGIMAGIAIPLLGNTTDKASKATAQRNAQSLCLLYNAAAQVRAPFTDNTDKEAIAQDLSDGVTGVDVVIPFKLSMSAGDVTAALEYCSLDTESNQMNYNPAGGEVDTEWGAWGVFGTYGSNSGQGGTLYWVDYDNSHYNAGGTAEFRVDPNDPLIEQVRYKK